MGYLKEKISPIDRLVAVHAHHLEVQNRQFIPVVKKEELTKEVLLKKDSLVTAYKELIAWVRAQANKLENTDSKLIVKALENRMAYLEYYAAYQKQYRPRFAARDSLMASNILWLLKHFPEEKFIISAHNYHISRFNEKELVMGELLQEQLGKEMYGIGVFAAGGAIANNSRKKEKLHPAQNVANLKNIISRCREEASFMDLTVMNDSSWLTQPIEVEGFVNLVSGKEIVLEKWFDGLLLLKEVSLPEFD